MIQAPRRILRLSGADTRSFLQGLITNDVTKVDAGLVYAAILTPQGKYLADFFLTADHDDLLLDVDTTLADMLVPRLTMYKLRADVTITEAALHLHRGLGAPPDDAFSDPRHESLGWRAYRDTPQAEDATDWTALYVAHVIPQTGAELTTDSFILEMDFERLNGVDFRKGCYVGQEVTARMKHKTELRKGLAKVTLAAPVPAQTPITKDGKPVGTVHSVSGTSALAYLRFDRAGDGMLAGDIPVTRAD